MNVANKQVGENIVTRKICHCCTYFVCKDSLVKRMLPRAWELGFQFKKINKTNVHNKGRVVQRADNAIHRISLNPVDKCNE